MAKAKRAATRKSPAKKQKTQPTSVPDLFAKATFDVADLIVANPHGRKALVKVAEKQIKSGYSEDHPFVYDPVSKAEIKKFLTFATDDKKMEAAGQWLSHHGISESSIHAAVGAIRKGKPAMGSAASKKLEHAFNRYAITCDLLEMWALFLMKLEQLEEV